MKESSRSIEHDLHAWSDVCTCVSRKGGKRNDEDRRGKENRSYEESTGQARFLAVTGKQRVYLKSVERERERESVSWQVERVDAVYERRHGTRPWGWSGKKRGCASPPPGLTLPRARHVEKRTRPM